MKIQLGDQLIVPIDGRDWVFERVKIEDLHLWKEHYGVVPVSLMGDPQRWPPVIKYTSPPEAATLIK